MSLKIFSDSHHGGLTRSLFLLFHERLGHDIYFPDPSFVHWSVDNSQPGVWLPVTDDHYRNLQGVPDRYLTDFPYHVSREAFLAQDWDALLVTRCESIPLFKKLIADHPNGHNFKIIGQAGNEKSTHDWNFVKNFMSSDYGSYMHCPAHKIFYSQELGHQYHQKEFVPIREEDLKTVATFTNCLPSFNSWHWDKDAWCWDDSCPHCEMKGVHPTPEISVFGLWNGMKEKMPECQFKDYGINNTYGMLSEKDMPAAYLGAACGYYFKTYEGYGHSILQSVALGRIPIVPRRFFQYRTARQYLMPFRTCLECDYTLDSLVHTIRDFTSNIHRANDMSYACWQTAQGLFNWEYEASRVKRFLEELV